MSIINSKRLLTPNEVAEVTNRGVGSVRRDLGSGVLPGINVSSGEGRPTWRVRPEDLDAWLASRSTTPQAPTSRKAKGSTAVREFY